MITVIRKSTQPIYSLGPTIYFGCDPEFFFERDGRIIGAEKVLPKEGKLGAERYSDFGPKSNGLNLSAFVLDGVQVELNPSPHTCRANLGNEIAAAFRVLKAHLEKMDGVKASFSATVTVPKRELDSLCDKAKLLGCAPSLNSYSSSAKIGVKDPAKFRKRSAGGHIHIGLGGDTFLYRERKRLVPILDILVGNTCVMIDRDPGAAERREHYGRAGEYRLPEHGLEYRTLSNFWLRSYQLMSFVMGMARLSVEVLATTDISGWNAEGELLKVANMKAIRHAINKNDIDVAKENYRTVREYLLDHCSYNSGHALDCDKVKLFDYFLEKIEQKGIERWFPEDPVTHWCAHKEGHGQGWESFLANTVGKQMLIEKSGKVPESVRL